MSTRFYYAQKDYIAQLNAMDDVVLAAAGSVTSAGASATAASASKDAAATSATSAATSATNAATSATNSSTSAGAASTSAGTATTKATDATGSATAAAGSATSASTSASTATTQAGTATTKAGEAVTSATSAASSSAAAGTSATNAATSATSANTSATGASGSATTATAQATAAATSATNAATSATNSATSATGASGSAATATTQAGNASTSATGAATYATSATGSATTATTQATNASTSATNAAGSATAAGTSATNAATSATTATTQATSATTSASTATTQAGTATTQATGAAGSATAAAASATTASTQATNAAASATAASGSATTATTQAAASSVSATNATSASTSAQAALTGTTSAAAQAANARDQAITASQVATASNEALAAISKTIHSGAIVAAKIYDTNKDSDGGAWRKRCQQTSWYQEAINGVWLGQAANELTARGDNLLTAPEEFDNSAWTKVNAAVTTNVFLSSVNSTLGDKVVPTAVSGPHQAAQQVMVTAGSVYTFQVELQAAGYTSVTLTTGSGMGSGGIGGTFDLSAGTASGSLTTIKPLGNGRYLCTLTGTATSTGNCFFYVQVNGVGTVQVYTGDGVSGVNVANAKVNQVGSIQSTYSGSPELVTNGGFDSGVTGWTLLAGVSVANGVAGFDGTTSQAIGIDLLNSATFATVVGQAYVVTYTVAGNLANNISSVFWTNGQPLAGGTQGAPGTYTDVFVAAATTATVAIRTRGSVGIRAGSVDNISCKQVTAVATPYVPMSVMATSFYQNTTDGKYYSLNATYGQTEVFRGNVREFPQQAAIVAEVNRVVIYDLTQVGCPMWMSFKAENSGGLYIAGSITALAVINGVVLVTGGEAINGVNFISDAFWFRTQYAAYTLANTVATRNVGRVNRIVDTTVNLKLALNSTSVNDVAVTVLPNAPTDPATGLPTPTIAVATVSGVSVIRDDGTVVNSATTGAWASLDFDSAQNLSGIQASAGHLATFGKVSTLGASFPTVNQYVYGQGFPTVPAFITAGTRLVAKQPGRTLSIGNTAGLSIIKESLLKANGMIAYVSNAFNTGWMVGDIRGAWLADTVAETITASGELVTNGTFTTDTSGWISAGNAVLSVVASKMRITATTAYGSASQIINLITGKTYILTIDIGTLTGGTFVNVIARDGGNLGVIAANTNSSNTLTFVATSGTASLIVESPNNPALVVDVDNISVKRALPDRSVKNNGMVINGTVTKAAVTAGAQLVGFSGFSAANYLEQPYNANLDFGTGDFCMMGWMQFVVGGSTMDIAQRSLGGSTGWRLIRTTSSGSASLALITGSASTTYIQGAAIYKDTAWHHVVCLRRSGVLYMYSDGVQDGNSAAMSNAIDDVTTLVIGKTGVAFGGMALLRIGATAPSADQIAKIYRDELALFQPNAQCTIDGTSTVVTALAYDDTSDILHVGTSWGRSAFNNLVRVESSATVVGAITSIAAGQGTHISGGASAARYYQPAMLLRDELRRKEDARQALGKIPEPIWFTGNGTALAFVLTKGFSPKFVYKQGLLMRDGGNDYTTSFDGFQWTVTFLDIPISGNNICIMGVKNG